MNSALVFGLVACLMVLALNWRAMASHGLARDQLVKVALVWLGIIIIVTAGVRLFAS